MQIGNTKKTMLLSSGLTLQLLHFVMLLLKEAACMYFINKDAPHNFVFASLVQL